MSAEKEVRAVIDSWAKAVSDGDRKAILAHHSDDVLMFDFPATVQGLDAWDFLLHQSARADQLRTA